MLTKIIISLLLTKTIAQLDGDFWWLSTKLDKYRTDSAQPKFEDLSEFDTDESSKILFKDEDYFPGDNLDDVNIFEAIKVNNSDKTKITMQFQDKSEIAFTDVLDNVSGVKRDDHHLNHSSQVKRVDNGLKELTNNDILEFKFPDDDRFIWKDTHRKNNTTETLSSTKVKENNTVRVDSNKIHFIAEKIPFKVQKEVVKDTENVCNFMKKSECVKIKGTVYYKHGSEPRGGPLENRFVCCILPLRPQFISSKIYFIDENRSTNRFKRSNLNDKTRTALNQRDTLMLKRFGPSFNKVGPITQRPANKVVTPADEYVDPYWNIKNKKFQFTNKQPHSIKETTSRYDYYGSDDYVEDYVVEIPSPGLVGLYSDHGSSNSAFNYSPGSDEESGLGYSPTIDPRLENRLATTKFHVSGRPVKLATHLNEITYNVETQTVSYQSNPDFQVLQGFKLLNLMRNQSRIRNSKKTTTEKVLHDESHEHVLTASSLESDYADGNGHQMNSECGRVVKGVIRQYDLEKQIGDTARGSHPSLALIVLTKKRQNVLCYATIVHNRAAITVADCVHGRTAPGEITLIAGAWRLNEESREDWQKRMATIHIHSQYKPGDLGNNLALLHWVRPLRFTANVQPACLSDPHVGDHCKFFGWGGYDQAIRTRSRWQRAIILTPNTCSERVPADRLPTDAFCASVQSRGTVTGIGGPLICDVGTRQSAVGVAIWRDHVVVLLPAQQWTIEALDDLQLD